MKELHSFAWYAARISPHLPKEAFKPVPSRLLGGLLYLIVIAASFFTILYFDPHLLLKLLISIVIGASFAGIGFLGHEILHGTVIRKPWVRDLLGAIAFWPLTTGPSLWRKWHNLNHHVHTQDEEKDPDAWASLEQLSRNPVLRFLYRIPISIRAFASFFSLAFTFTFHSFTMFIRFSKEYKGKKKPVVFLQFLLPWVFWISLIFFVGFVQWLFIFLIPVLIANFIVMSYISTNHRLNPLVDVNDPLANSLSVNVPWWVDKLHFNFSYHAEHHLFPGMNPKFYPLVKEQIKKMWPDRYFEMPLHTALIALWKTPRVYYKNNELIDPRLGNKYDSLGHGLDPNNITYRPGQEQVKNKLNSLEVLLKQPKFDKE